MDIHRCRFVQYPPQAINSVAFTHSSLPSTSASKKNSTQKHVQVRLAIGRGNGDIEIWNPANGVWHQELVIPGGEDRSVDGLVWVTDPDEEMTDGKLICGKSRLFSIGYSNTITEWDLEKGRAKKHASGQHGDIWCLGIQPLPNKATVNTSRKLVAGTADGNLVLYSIEDGDLKFEKSLIRTPSKKVKFVSIAFQNRNVVVVGCSNSTICAYDIRNGALLRQMSLGADLSGGPKSIIVWAVKCLPNGDIVSGDSTGQVRIYDGKTYTQAQRIQSHSQDVLSLAVAADGSKIFSGGMDRKTSVFIPVPGQNRRWSKKYHRRYHTHDVKAMASFEGKGMSVLVSGGPDGNPVVMPLRMAGNENHRTLPNLPQATTVESAPKARFMLSWWGNEVRLWHLPSPAQQILEDASTTQNFTSQSLRKNRKLLAKIYVKGESHISSATISEDGTLLVAATSTDIKVFQLDYATGQPPQIKKIELATSGQGASRVQIASNKQWISWVEDGSKVMIAKVQPAGDGSYTISSPSKLARLRRQISKNLLLGGLGTYNRNITQLTFSPNSKMLAAADLGGYMDTWVLRVPGEQPLTNGTTANSDDEASSDDSSSDASSSESDPNTERWVRSPNARLLPKLSAAPVVLSFSPRDDYSLLVVTVMKQVLVFNALQGVLSEWSRRNTYPRLPERFRITRDVMKGVVWQGDRIWLWGVSSLFMLDLSRDLESVDESVKGKKEKSKKRKRNGGAGDGSGAGSKMEGREAIGPHIVKKAVHTEEGETNWEEMELDGDDGASSVAGGSEFEDEEDDHEEGELMKLRQGEEQQQQHQEGANGTLAVVETEKKSRWWFTYQFRPILGVVGLGEENEIAVVERPVEVEGGKERYFGEGEWER
ncbi:quinon protein alcohol dehydrogenase-like superfamily [Triangularia verruculosa]|uniref:Quinon protein alcohol dehydrogenase-like superfamily n=1 Tax=Triangularia verruculosa TaxID=2587418 RepID=A0AAN6XRK3_9PEZI|nr:quinon protein alcohol dehydrogenase-like superfamily [Triangularia verruculosa]